MKTYQIIVRTSYYKTIEVEAEGYQQAKDAAWDYVAGNNMIKDAPSETDFYSIEEVEE